MRSSIPMTEPVCGYVLRERMAYRKGQGCVEAGMTLFGACKVSVADRRF